MFVATSENDRRVLAALLDWYTASGVDLALDDAPHDRFAECAARMESGPAPDIAVAPDAHPALEASCEVPAHRPPRAVPAASARLPAAPVFPDEAVRDAEAAAARARTLDELRESLEAFEGCGLKRLAERFHFCAGAPGARLMVLDIAPGEEEERGGEAFRGLEAALLDNMLAAIGLTRETAYLAYFSPWRPASEGAVPPHEAAALAPFARRHVELARPELVVLLGDPLARLVFGVQESGARTYGRWLEETAGEAPRAIAPRVMALPSLRAMLKTPTLKRAAWRGLRAVAQALA